MKLVIKICYKASSVSVAVNGQAYVKDLSSVRFQKCLEFS